MTKKSFKIIRWVSLSVLVATSARVLYSVYKEKKSREKLEAVLPRVCSLCGEDHFLQNLERLHDGPYCKQFYTPLTTSDGVHCENEYAHSTFPPEMPEMNDKTCTACEHASHTFMKNSLSTCKNVKRELSWSERLLWLMFPHWYAPVTISHNQVSLQRVNHSTQNEITKQDLYICHAKEKTNSNNKNNEMKEFRTELTETECKRNTYNVNHDRRRSQKKLDTQDAKISCTNNANAKADSNSATITKFAEALQTLLPSPGRRPTVAVIECPLHADIKIDAELLWEALQSDESVYVDGLIDLVIIETDSTTNMVKEFNLQNRLNDKKDNNNDDDDDYSEYDANSKNEAIHNDDLLCKIATTKREAATTENARKVAEPISMKGLSKFEKTIEVEQERKHPSLNVNDIMDTMERKNTTPEFLRFSLCDAYSFYTTLYAASFLQLYDDEVVSELDSFCDEASRRGSMNSKGEGPFFSLTHDCSAQSFSVSFLPSNHWNEPPETPTSPVQRLVRAISEFPHNSPLRSPSKLLQPPNKMFSRIELEHCSSGNYFPHSAFDTRYFNTVDICVRCDSTSKNENRNDDSKLKYFNGHKNSNCYFCNDTNNDSSSNDPTYSNSNTMQLRKCTTTTTTTSENRNNGATKQVDTVDNKCVIDEEENELKPTFMPKLECCHYTVHESTTYHIYVLHQGRSSQVATAALEELLANMRVEMHEANLFSQVATNTQKENGVKVNNRSKQNSPHTRYNYGNDKFDFLTFCAQEEMTEVENDQVPELQQEEMEIYKHECKNDWNNREEHNNYFENNNCSNNKCTPNISTTNLHAINSTECTTEECAKMRRLREQLCYHAQLRTNIIEYFRSHHLTHLVEITLPDMRVYRQTPPCIPRATAAFARGFNIYKTFALEMFMREREWREQQTNVACTPDSDYTSNTLTEKTIDIYNDIDGGVSINRNSNNSNNNNNNNRISGNNSNDKYVSMYNETAVQSKSEFQKCKNDAQWQESNDVQQFDSEWVKSYLYLNEETSLSQQEQHELLKCTSSLLNNWWHKICCFVSSTSAITNLFASNNLLLSSGTSGANQKTKPYIERKTDWEYDVKECEELEEKEQQYVKNTDMTQQDNSYSVEYNNNGRTENVLCVCKCINEDCSEHLNVQLSEHDEIDVPSIQPQINCINNHKHISITSNNNSNVAHHASLTVNTHNRTHTYSYHTRCLESQRGHNENGPLKMTTSHYSIPQSPLDTSECNTLVNSYCVPHESITRTGQATVRPHMMITERKMEESNIKTQNNAINEHTRLPCNEEKIDGKRAETLESSETVRTNTTTEGNEIVTEYLSSSYRDAQQLNWVPSREHAAVFYTLGDVNAALFDAATQPSTEQDEWYLQPSGQSLSSSTITNASSLQEALSSHQSSASLQFVINKQNEVLQKDSNRNREVEHVYKSDGNVWGHMTSELRYSTNSNINVNTTFTNNIHHIHSGSINSNIIPNNTTTNNNHNNSSGFLEYWSQKLPWVPWSETSSVGKLQEQVEPTHIWDDDKEKMHLSYEYSVFHKNNPLNVESPTSGNVNDEYERWVEHCQCVEYNRNVHFYSLFWHLHRMFYERITKLQKQYAELSYIANNNEHGAHGHKPEPLWSPLEINGSNQVANRKVVNVSSVESMNVNTDHLNEHNCQKHNLSNTTVNDNCSSGDNCTDASTKIKSSANNWFIDRLTNAKELLGFHLPKWCHTKCGAFHENNCRDTHMCIREHGNDVNTCKNANTATTQLAENNDDNENEMEQKEKNRKIYDSNEDEDEDEDEDDVIIDFNGHRRKRVELPINNGQYGLTPFEVWLATRYSTKIAAEVYLLDVLASKGDHFYPMSTVLDEILYHAILFYHNGNLRDFVDDLLTNFNLEYIPHTKWGEEVLTSSTIPSCSTEEHEGSCLSSESQQGNRISSHTESHTRCCQPCKALAEEQYEEEYSIEELPLEEIPHKHLTQVNGNEMWKIKHSVNVTVTGRNNENDTSNNNHSNTSSLASSLSSRTSQYCSKTSCHHCKLSLTLMTDGGHDNANMFSSATTDVIEQEEEKYCSQDKDTNNASEGIGHTSETNLCSEEVTTGTGGEATKTPTLCANTKLDEIITLYDVAIKMLQHQRRVGTSSSAGKFNILRNWNTQESLSSTALNCNMSESCSLRQAKIDELEALRLLECEMKYLKEFIIRNRNSLLSATLTAQGANKLEGVFGVPATVFPFVLCARESISVIHNVFLGMNKCYGTLRFSSFTTFIRDVFSRDRPEVIRHAPRIFRTLNKSRRGYINYEELCGWFARKLSCGNNVRPNMHFIATCMTLRLLLLLILDQKPLWPYLECTIESLSDGET